MVSIIVIFLVDKLAKNGMGKIGMSKISVYLIMFLVFSVKVLALEHDYARENLFFGLTTMFLILGLIYLIYQRLFKAK